MFKKFVIYFISLISLVLVLPNGSVAQDQLELVDSALASLNLTRSDIKFDQDEVATWGGDRFRLKYFTLFHNDPFKLPRHGELTLESLGSNVMNPPALISKASRFLDHAIFRSLIGNPLAPFIDFADSVVPHSITRSKNILVGAEFNSLKDRIDLFYRIADDKKFMFKKSLDDANKNKYRQRLYEYFLNNNEDYHDLVYELTEKVDFDRLYAGAQDFALAAKIFIDSASILKFPDHILEFKTRKGLIVIGTPGDDKFIYLEPPFLIIDGGGDDLYEFSGYPDEYPFTMIFDLAGNDKYRSTDTASPGIGGSILGMCILVDLDGDDIYEAKNIAQGASIFGVSIHIDRNGNDTYIAEHFSQGAATFGIGILADSSGHDSLYCLSTSQGYGYTQGIGILVNHSGNDRYVAEDQTIFDPSPQTKEHNSSLAQGVGFGKRADYIDGHSWAGGIGILCDVSGDDIYSAGLFTQGCGYWYAVGMLLDGSGVDSYNAAWYAQGAGAHFAVGYLDDFRGDDSYTTQLNMGVGAGHDFTIGYFNERSGNDRYKVPNLSLGGGNVNGFGIFHDHAGDDFYDTDHGFTLGRANGSQKGPRKYLKTVGIFVDGGGIDSYGEHYAGNNKRWVSPLAKETEPNKVTIGVGIDRD